MIVISEIIGIDGWQTQVEILSEKTSHWMNITAYPPKGGEPVVRRDGTYTSLKSLSSDLRCTLGLSDAEKVLRQAGIPEGSDLWFLNYR